MSYVHFKKNVDVQKDILLNIDHSVSFFQQYKKFYLDFEITRRKIMIYSLKNTTVKFTGDDYFIAENAIVIGSVIIDNNVSVWFNTVIRADNDTISIGENSNIQDGSVLHTDEGIQLSIGKNVTVGHMAVLHGCTIGDNCLVGIKSVVLDNTEIGNYCMIGADTLVTAGTKIPDGSLVLGSPGKVVRQLNKKDISMIDRAAKHYVKNFKRYKREMEPGSPH